MSSVTTMKKKSAGRKKDRGGSEFSRARLDEEYNPKLRLFKKELMNMSPINEKQRYGYIAKEESQACDQAIQSLKNGCRLMIDWKEPSIFRVTQTKPTFPRLKTEPIPYLNRQSLEQRRQSLAQMLRVRHRKHYMRSRQQLEEEKQQHNNHNNDSPPLHPLIRGFTADQAIPQHLGLEQEQELILKNSNLCFLKEELKEKLVQIRQTYKGHGGKKEENAQAHSPVHSSAVDKLFFCESSGDNNKEKIDSKATIYKRLKKKRSGKKRKMGWSGENDFLGSEQLRLLKDRVKSRFVQLRDLQMMGRNVGPKRDDSKQSQSAFL